jgi:polysaccharide deacetylase 2 family uncharacterized protein YibQ
MGVVRKILIFLVLTAGIIMLGRLATRVLPKRTSSTGTASNSDKPSHNPSPNSEAPLLDSTNALPPVLEDTTGGKWNQKLFLPILRSYGLPEKQIKPKQGFFEITFPKGKPIHEYALEIENLCRQNEITVEQGAELRPAGHIIEYLLQSNGQHIKLRAKIGTGSMAGAARVAIVISEIDSLDETELAALEAAAWDKSLVVNAYSPNQTLKKLRFTSARNEVLLELPMEPSSYPFVDPGKHGIFIHHTQEEIGKILSEGFDSLPHAKGFVTKYGDRAIENLPLLDNLFLYIAGKDLTFLDLTGSPRSLARQAAAAHGARCRSLTAFKDGSHLEEELIRKAMQATKTGEAVLVLPYRQTDFKNLERILLTNEDRFRELGLEFVTYSALLSVPGDSALPDTRPPSAKPKPSALPLSPPSPPPKTHPAPTKVPAPASNKKLQPTPKPSPKLMKKTIRKPAVKTTVKKKVTKPAAVKKSQ